MLDIRRGISQLYNLREDTEIGLDDVEEEEEEQNFTALELKFNSTQLPHVRLSLLGSSCNEQLKKYTPWRDIRNFLERADQRMNVSVCFPIKT